MKEVERLMDVRGERVRKGVGAEGENRAGHCVIWDKDTGSRAIITGSGRLALELDGGLAGWLVV